MKKTNILLSFILLLSLFSSPNYAFCVNIGDVDGDGFIDLKDVIISLQISSGIKPNSLSIHTESDINNNGKIGLEEAVYALQVISGIREQNSAPVANAGSNENKMLGEFVILDGSQSTDADQDTLKYQWEIISAPAESLSTLSCPTLSKAVFLPDKIGTYIIQLIVDDGKVLSAPDMVSIEIENSTYKIVPVHDSSTLNNSGSHGFFSAYVNEFGIMRSYLMFDLSDLPEKIVSRATLNLYCYGTNANQYIALHHVSDDTWTEDTINIDNAPSFDAQEILAKDILDASIPGESLPTWMKLDIDTNILNSKSDLEDGKLSLALKILHEDVESYYSEECIESCDNWPNCPIDQGCLEEGIAWHEYELDVCSENYNLCNDDDDQCFEDYEQCLIDIGFIEDYHFFSKEYKEEWSPSLEIKLGTNQLFLFPPRISAPFVSEIPYEFKVQTFYNGGNSISYVLEEGPQGMIIDTQSGLLSWKPTKDMEGELFDVGVRATDGELETHIGFSVKVAVKDVVTISVDGKKIEVIEDGSLKDMSLTLPTVGDVYRLGSEDIILPSEVEVSTFNDNQGAKLPEGVTKLTDFFGVTPIETSSGDIQISFPIDRIPVGVPFTNIHLFTYTLRADQKGNGEFIWSSTQRKFKFDPENNNISIELRGYGELSFLGFRTYEKNTNTACESPTSYTVNDISVHCTPLTSMSWVRDIDDDLSRVYDECSQECQIDGEDLIVEVNNFFIKDSWSNSSNVSLGDLVYWVYKARKEAEQLHLDSDNYITIRLDYIPRDDEGGFTYGYVHPLENREVLHINTGINNIDDVKVTIAHEFFHHAQSRSIRSGEKNILNHKNKLNFKWIYEGTATWFEDYVWDDLNSYITSVRLPLSHLTSLTSGSYDRFAFWKMIEKECSNLDLGDIFNVNASDIDGTKKLGDVLANKWDVNFSNVGSIDSTFKQAHAVELAIFNYNYAAILENNINLLDKQGNEPIESHFINIKDKMLIYCIPDIFRLLCPPEGISIAKGAVKVEPNGYSHFILERKYRNNESNQISSGLYTEVLNGTEVIHGMAALNEDLSPKVSSWWVRKLSRADEYGTKLTFVTVINPSQSQIILELGIAGSCIPE